DTTLAELHGQFLEDPTPTDVMAFDLRDEDSGDGAPQEGEREVEGEIYVSLDRARWMMGEGASAERTATEVPASTRDLASEVLLYAVHGALHLCGFDDHEPEERRAMRRAEIAVFRELGRQLNEDAHLDA
ncbi:MAG: rRNA maturation RNase YbeY, partial [Planctomycetota bacterium]